MLPREQAPDHPDPTLLVDFGLGRLNPAESLSLEEHLSECPDCRETLHSLKDKGVSAASSESTGDDQHSGDLSGQTPTDTPNLDDAGSCAATMLVERSQNVEQSELPEELREHPRYRIVEQIGEGGMGDVYRAEHKLMNRPVALKLINAQLIRHPQAVERFRREVQAAAQLAHPNIVAAYDAEQNGDVHFLAMEFVEGTDLAAVVSRRGKRPIKEACDYIRQAALGLQHAQEKGMVHRDIKPHNLMLSPDGQVRILDFGLAGFATESAIIEADSTSGTDGDTTPLHLTSFGSVMGTPDYIAPEQARDAHSADIRADVYSLGCTFRYLLTRQPPFTADSVVDKLKAHMEQAPSPLGEHRDDVPDELAAIVERMIAKDPDARFQTPADVAAALSAFAGDETRAALERSQPTRLRPLVLLSGIVTLLAAVIYIATTKGNFEVRSEVDGVQVTVSRDGDSVRVLDVNSGTSLFWLPADRFQVTASGDTAVSVSRENVYVSWMGRQIVEVRRAAARDESTMPPVLDELQQDVVRSAQPFLALLDKGSFGDAYDSLSAIGKRAATRGQFSSSIQGLRDTFGKATKRTLREVQLIDTFPGLPERRYAVVQFKSDFDRQEGLWESVLLNVETTDEWRVNTYANSLKPLLIPQSKRTQLTRPRLQEIQIAESGRLVGHTDDINAIEFSLDGEFLFSGGGEKSLYQWDVASGKVVRQIPVGDYVRGIAVLPDGGHVISSQVGGSVTLWNLADQSSVRQFSGHTKPVNAICVSPDGKRLLSGGNDGLVRLWEIETGEAVYSTTARYCNAVAMTRDGRLAAHGTANGGWKIWETESHKVLPQIRRQSKSLDCLTFSPDGKHLASGDGNGVIQVWEVSTGKEIHRFDAHQDRVASLVFTPDGRHFLSGSYDQTLLIFEMARGLEVGRVATDTLCVTRLAMSPNGHTVASGGGIHQKLVNGAWTQRKDGDFDIRVWQLPQSVWSKPTDSTPGR